MALATFSVPAEYGYVILSATSTFFLGFWHGVRVGGFRKVAGVGYPCPYADSAQMNTTEPEKKKNMYLFNCAQRAHGNYLENQPSVVAAMLIAGLKYPLLTVALSAGWQIFRVVYAVGYTNPEKTNGKGRMLGSFFWLFQLGLFLSAGYTGYQMLGL